MSPENRHRDAGHGHVHRASTRPGFVSPENCPVAGARINRFSTASTRPGFVSPENLPRLQPYTPSTVASTRPGFVSPENMEAKTEVKTETKTLQRGRAS